MIGPQIALNVPNCLEQPTFEHKRGQVFQHPQLLPQHKPPRSTYQRSVLVGICLTSPFSWFPKTAGNAMCRQWLNLTGLHERDLAAEMKCVNKDTRRGGGRSWMKGRELGACLSISKAAFTSTSPSAIWRCEGADELKAARQGFVCDEVVAGLSRPNCQHTDQYSFLRSDLNPRWARVHQQSNY